MALQFWCWLYLGASVISDRGGEIPEGGSEPNLTQALGIACPSLTAVGVKGNKTDCIIWLVRYLNLDSVNASTVKTQLRGNYSLQIALKLHTKTLVPPCESLAFMIV